MKILSNYLDYLKENNPLEYSRIMRGYDTEQHLIKAVTPWMDEKDVYEGD